MTAEELTEEFLSAYAHVNRIKGTPGVLEFPPLGDIRAKPPTPTKGSGTQNEIRIRHYVVRGDTQEQALLNLRERFSKDRNPRHNAIILRSPVDASYDPYSEDWYASVSFGTGELQEA